MPRSEQKEGPHVSTVNEEKVGGDVLHSEEAKRAKREEGSVWSSVPLTTRERGNKLWLGMTLIFRVGFEARPDYYMAGKRQGQRRRRGSGRRGVGRRRLTTLRVKV